MSKGDIQFYADTLIVETVLGNPKFLKTAQASEMTGIMSATHDLVNAHINPEDKLGSVINILVPGALMIALPFPFGILMGLAIDVFHIDIAGIFSTFWNSISGEFGAGQKVTQQQVDEHMDAAVKQHSQTPEVAKIQKQNFKKTLHDAQMLRLSIEHYNNYLIKNAGSSLYNQALKNPTNIISTILKWIVKVALASAGLLVAGDFINKWFGRPNALEHTYQAGQDPVAPTAATLTSVPAATQTKFPFKSDSTLPSLVSDAPSPDNIDAHIVQWAKDVYSGLDGLENVIKNTIGFKAIKNQIIWNNSYGASDGGSHVISIPLIAKSKKDLVDNFIDDVAKNSP